MPEVHLVYTNPSLSSFDNSSTDLCYKYSVGVLSLSESDDFCLLVVMSLFTATLWLVTGQVRRKSASPSLLSNSKLTKSYQVFQASTIYYAPN